MASVQCGPIPRESAIFPKIIIAANRKSGARSREQEIRDLVAALRSAGLGEASIVPLDEIAEAVQAPVYYNTHPVVIAAGGDGTVAAVANATDSQKPLLPYPLGTENLLARYLGIRADPQQICDILRASRTFLFDAGSANGRLFLLMASCGFDADVVRRMENIRRGNINHLSYLQPIYESVFGYQFPTIRVTIADALGEEQIVSGKWTFIVNIPRYAGGLQIVPAAQVADGLLDVCIFKRGSLMHSLAYLGGVVTGAHTTWPDCHIASGKTIRLESDEPVPYQLDGDHGGFLPLEIQTHQQRVQVLVPPEWQDVATRC